MSALPRFHPSPSMAYNPDKQANTTTTNTTTNTSGSGNFDTATTKMDHYHQKSLDTTHSTATGNNDDSHIPSPVGDLSAYRAGMDTDRQAVWGPFGIFNQVTSILVNFFVNVGALYGGAYAHDFVGVWKVPNSPNPYGLEVWADWLMTSILVVAGMGLLATPGQWLSIWAGQARPVPGRYLTGPNAHWYWKMAPSAFYPKGAKMFIVRTILMVLQFSAPFYGICMLIFFGMCKSNNIFAGPGESVGSNPGRGQDPQCWIDPLIYIWVRAAVFTVLGAFVYPIAYVAALDVENCPAWALNKWKAAMVKKGIVKDSVQGQQPLTTTPETRENSRV